PSKGQPLGRRAVIGVHTRLTDEVEPWKIERTFSMLREMGAHWAVEYFPWAYVEYGDGRYDWRHSDLIVNAAYASGLELIARLDYVPAWARPPNTNPRYLSPEGQARFVAFLRQFAARYAGRVRYYLIWNEPNLTAEWGFRPVSP